MAQGARHQSRHPADRKVQYEYDKAAYKQRNTIEHMFCRLKDWRRIHTRFERNVRNFMADRPRRSSHLVAVMSPDPSRRKRWRKFFSFSAGVSRGIKFRSRASAEAPSRRNHIPLSSRP